LHVHQISLLPQILVTREKLRGNWQRGSGTTPSNGAKIPPGTPGKNRPRGSTEGRTADRAARVPGGGPGVDGGEKGDPQRVGGNGGGQDGPSVRGSTERDGGSAAMS